MRCDPCQGKGKRWYWSASTPNARMLLPCRECGGFGEVSCCEGSERYGQLPDVEIKVTPIEKLLDDVIDSTFMKQGFKPSRHREAILEALKREGYEIVRKGIENDAAQQN